MRIIICLSVIVVIIISIDGKGGRGGRGGKSAGVRSSSRNGIFHISYSNSHINAEAGRGWFHGFFNSRPSRIYYAPSYIRSSSHTNTVAHTTAESKTDAEEFLVAYSISRVLSSDFFSLFNIISDISEYSDRSRNYIINKIEYESESKKSMKTFENAAIEITDKPFWNSDSLNDLLQQLDYTAIYNKMQQRIQNINHYDTENEKQELSPTEIDISFETTTKQL